MHVHISARAGQANLTETNFMSRYADYRSKGASVCGVRWHGRHLCLYLRGHGVLDIQAQETLVNWSELHRVGGE
jgi:hypothetical protein